MPSALINIVTLYTVMYNDIMYIRNYKKNLNIAESTSLQNVNLVEFILAFLEGPLKYAKISTPPYGTTRHKIMQFLSLIYAT